MINLLNGWDLYILFLGGFEDETHTVGKVLGEVAAREIGDESAGHFFHGGEDTLEGLDGLEFVGQGLGICTLVIVEDTRNAAWF